MKKAEQNIKELQDNYKGCNIFIIQILEGEERKKQKQIFENF